MGLPRTSRGPNRPGQDRRPRQDNNVSSRALVRLLHILDVASDPSLWGIHVPVSTRASYSGDGCCGLVAASPILQADFWLYRHLCAHLTPADRCLAPTNAHDGERVPPNMW